MDGRRALVIDDEVHFRYFLRVLLEKAGFAVKMARNGIEALDVLRSWRPDVITLDVMMPEIDGLTACRTIREFSDVPIIMLTARTEDMDKLLGFEQGRLPRRGLETHSRGHAVRRADLRPGTCVRHDRPDAGPASRPRGLP